jgi:hypothetical protein
MPDLQGVEMQALVVERLRDLLATQEAALRDQALQAHRNGAKIAVVSRAARVSRPTFYGWLETQPDD